MKQTEYLVWFLLGSSIRCFCFSATDAAIIATAEKLKNGENCYIQSIENLETGEILISFPCHLVLVEK